MPRSRASGYAIWRVRAATAGSRPRSGLASGVRFATRERHRGFKPRHRSPVAPRARQPTPRRQRSRGIDHLATHENAPSRLRPRPTFRLTTAEATTTRRAINLGHSVLGASGTLWVDARPVKRRADGIRRKLRARIRRPSEARSPSSPEPSRPTVGSRRSCPRTRGPRKCTEPVAPSSGFPTDCRRSGRRSESHQPRTLRTRCIAHSREAVPDRQGAASRSCRKLRSFLFATGRTALRGACSST
jgi:hypothetical protein